MNEDAVEIITPDQPEAHSADILAENIEALKALFPEIVIEGKIDIEILKQLLGGEVEEREEKYGLNWHGKRQARQLALTPSTGTLRPCPEESVDWDTTQNLMIEGDNLEVLKLLQKSYAGKVKLIYIDPPYNTGNDFVYHDDFRDNIQNYLELTGQVKGGQRLSTNAEAHGRFHTNWLNMMYPRLKLARNLLRPDGVFCMSVDDSELKNAELILDEVFGSECFLGCVVRATGTTTGQDSGGLGQSFDYMLCYARDADTELNGLPLEEADEKRFQDEDEHGRYSVLQLRKTGNADRREDRPSMYYAVPAPDGSQVLPIGPGGYESRWRFGPATYQQALDDGMIVWKEVERDQHLTWQPYVKYYLAGRTKRPSPLWDDLDGNKKATIEVRELLGDKAFSNPKPVAFVRRTIQMTFGANDGGLIVDFFAGSGTTGHAVMAQNCAYHSTLRFILVQLPEPLDPNNASQAIAARLCDSIGKPRTVAALAEERLRRAGAKLSGENPLFAGDTGFRVFKLDSTNIQSWDPEPDELELTLERHTEHLKADRTEEDILFELLLKLGLDLCVPIVTREFDGKTVHSIGGGALIVCLDPSITRDDVDALATGIAGWRTELAPAGDTECVFRDSAFADDVAKTNLAEILKQHGIKQVRSL